MVYLIFGVKDLFDERLFEEIVVDVDINDCCSVFVFNDSLLEDIKDKNELKNT